MRTTDRRGARLPSRLSLRRWVSIVGLAAGSSALLIVGVLAIPSPASAAAPLLGTAASYSVLAGSTVTNTGATTTNGDVGVSPGTAITGFPPGLVGPPGTLHANDGSAIGAQADLGTAYTTAQGLPHTGILGDISNQTFVAGVYNASSTLQFTGPIILNGQNDPTSVFVFQVGSALTTADASTVILENDAQACNVFWQVTSSATLGGASVFQGTIMANQSISVGTAATIEGRTLAQVGAVTLDNDHFVEPSCDLTPPPSPTTTPPTTTPPTTTPPTTTPPTTTTPTPPPTTPIPTPPTTPTPTPPTTPTPVTPVTAAPVAPTATSPGGTGPNLTAPIAALASTGSGGGGRGSGGTGAGPATSSLVTGSGGNGATQLAFTGSSPWLVPAVYLGAGAAALGALLFLLVGPNSGSRRVRKSR